MKISLNHIIAILIIVTAGCSGAPDKKQQTAEKRFHPVSITGIVTSVSRISAARSGSSAEYMLHFTVKIEFYEDGGWEIILGPEIKIVCSENDLTGQTGRKLEAGQRVNITSSVSEKSPAEITAQTVNFI